MATTRTLTSDHARATAASTQPVTGGVSARDRLSGEADAANRGRALAPVVHEGACGAAVHDDTRARGTPARSLVAAAMAINIPQKSSSVSIPSRPGRYTDEFEYGPVPCASILCIASLFFSNSPLCVRRCCAALC